jgi:hypothetical protein
METPSGRSDPILGSRIHDLLKTCKLGISPLLEDARRNRRRVCLKSLWYCGRGYNQPSYSRPLPSYVRAVFAVPDLMHQIREEEDVSVRVIGRCFGSLLAKKLAQDVTDHPQRYARTNTELFITQAELISLSTILETTSRNVMDWLGKRGVISLANIIALATSEAELLVANNVPSDALDIFQKTLEILVETLPYPSADLSDDLAVQFCKLYSKVDDVWATIWLKYKLRPIHERLLGINSAYSSAWSQMQTTDGSQPSPLVVGADPWAGNDLPSDRTGHLSEPWRLSSNEIAISPTGEQSQLYNMASTDFASVVSLFPSSIHGAELSSVLPLDDPEMESISVAADEQADVRTAEELEQILDLTTGIRHGTGENS